MNTTERRYELLFGDELYDLMAQRALAWVPLGILEEHGGHLPWGLDGLKAHAVCMRLASQLGGVVLPATHLAGIHGDCKDEDEDAFRKRHAEVGDFLYREATFKQLLTETFDSLSNIGFQVIVAYTGHYPTIQMRILQSAADEFNKTSKTTVIPFWEVLACGDGDHAGKWETSIYLALAPEGVRLNAIRDARTGQDGYYRGTEVRSQVSREFGEQALKNVEAYLSDAVNRAFTTQ